MGKSQELQKRVFSVVLYTETTSYKVDEVLSKLDKVFFQWAYIIHHSDTWSSDDDEVKDGKYEVGTRKKEHVQIVGRCICPLTFQTVANHLGIPVNFVKKSKGNFRKGVRYLIHLDHPNKFQYDHNDIISNFNHTEFLGLMSQTEMASSILAIIDMGECKSKRELLKACIDSGLYSEYLRGYKIWVDIFVEQMIKHNGKEWRFDK